MNSNNLSIYLHLITCFKLAPANFQVVHFLSARILVAFQQSKLTTNNYPLFLTWHITMEKLLEGSLLAKTIYGTKSVSEETWLNYAYALLIISGADDLVSPPEMDWLLEDFAPIINAPDDFVERIKAFEYRDRELQEVLPKIKFPPQINYRRLLLYDAIRMAFADNEYSADEKQAVQQTAALLGVQKFYAQAIEGLVNTEKSLENIRKSIFEFNNNYHESEEPPTANLAIRRMYGLTKINDTMRFNYGCALMLISGADGFIAEEERDWYLNYFAKITDTSEEIIERVKLEVESKDADLTKFLQKLKQESEEINFARTLIYAAIKMARADGVYAKEEKEAVEYSASLLGVPQNILKTLNFLAQTEENISKMRKTLFQMKD